MDASPLLQSARYELRRALKACKNDKDKTLRTLDTQLRVTQTLMEVGELEVQLKLKKKSYIVGVNSRLEYKCEKTRKAIRKRKRQLTRSTSRKLLPSIGSLKNVRTFQGNPFKDSSETNPNLVSSKTKSESDLHI